MSPEQLLALVAANAPEAALALAERYRAEAAISPETYAEVCDRVENAASAVSEAEPNAEDEPEGQELA
jgi:hypothetical protein